MASTPPDRTEVAAEDPVAVLQRADTAWRAAEDFAAAKNFEAAIAAGEEALELIKRRDFGRYGEWKRQVDAWQVKAGDKEAAERWWRRALFGRVPVWAVGATAGILVGGDVLYEPIAKWLEHRRHAADVQALVTEGTSALDRGKLAEARAKFKDALAKDEGNGVAELGLLITEVYDLTRDGQYDPETIAARVDDLRARDERTRQKLHAHVLTVEGNIAFHRQDLATATISYAEAIGARSTVVEAHTNLGTVHYFEHDFADAGVEYQRALELSPENQDAASGVAAVGIALGKFKQALATDERILAAESDRLQVRLEVATLLRISGQLERAFEEQQRTASQFDASLKLPKNDAPWALLVYRDGADEPPWIAQTTVQKKYYLAQELAATAHLLGQQAQAEQFAHVEPAAMPNSSDSRSIRTIVAYELGAMARQDASRAESVRACIEWLSKEASPSETSPGARLSAKPTPLGKAAGTRCTSSGQCRAGLACCASSFRGHCGGAVTADVEKDPCVVLSTCTPAPCLPLSMPP